MRIILLVFVLTIMGCTKGTKMNGFKLVKKEVIEELKSTGWLYEHEKTGARVLFMDNKEKEKVFSIAFRTPPKDDTGVAHIAEHSVLCGSKKYPTKEPFVELMKGSVNTFLNAMTFTDWTLYPVASKNAKDFRNLTDVYLDAVFFPLMKETPYTLKQEGWHYEYDQDKKELSINGIVYNEMKGVFSSPDAVGWTELYKELYPDSNYRNESGGMPESIPDLTQKGFVDFHNKYYHPSNSYTLVSGDLDIEEFLSYIDKEYFSKFEKLDPKISIPIQPAFKKIKEVVTPYSVGKDEPTEGKTYFYYAVSYDTVKNIDLGFSMDILRSILVDFPSSPLKRALVDAKIVTDLSASVEDSIYQPNIMFVGMGGNKEDAPKFKKILLETLQKLAKTGFDSELVKAAVNRIEFKLRELDFNRTPRGIVYHIMNLPNWTHEGDAFKGFHFAKRLKKIKDEIGKGHFEKIIKDNILQNQHAVFMTLVPSPGLEEKRNDEFKKKMAAKLKTLSKKELDEIVADTKKLKERQKQEDSPEALASIPLLEKNDLDKKNEVIPMKVEKEEGITYLLHPYSTNGIGYFKFHFDASSVTEEEIPYLGLLVEMLSKLSTKSYNYKDLSNVIYSNTGGISVDTNVYTREFSLDKYRPYIVVNGKALAGDQKKLFDLIQEITLHTRFDEKERIRELVSKLKSGLESGLASHGMDYAISTASSHLGGGPAYEEKLDGASFFKFMIDLDKNFDKRYEDLITQFKNISKKVFTTQGLVSAVAIDEDKMESFVKELKGFSTRYPKLEKASTPPLFAPKYGRQAIVIGGKVQYVVKTANAHELGYEGYKGDIKVLENIFNASFLWNKIRVLGGAYGGFFRMNSNGLLYFASYRDPHLVESLEIYGQAAKYLEELKLDERELNKNIIGAIGKFDVPTSPQRKLAISANYYMKGISDDFLQKLREEVFATNLEKVKAYSSFFKKVAAVKNYAVAGSEEKINKNKSIFDTVIKFWN